MMNHGETVAALELHGRKNRQEAELQRQYANDAMIGAHEYASKHAGDDMAQRRERILAEGEAKASEHKARAARADERARTAERGFLLHGDVECRDSGYCMGHQRLIAAAGHHGLLAGEPKG